MGRTSQVLLTVTVLLASVTSHAFGDAQLRKPERRPYITEIGEPYSISMATVNREAAKVSELAEYVDDYGYPDYAEIQEIEPEWPWESYEVRLYYMQRDLEADFGHVILSAAFPNFGVMKYRGDISPDKRHQIEVILEARKAAPAPPAVQTAIAPAAVAPAAVEEPHTGGLTEALVARIEAAAERAAQAADQAAEQSEAAVRAADRTVNLVDEMERNAGGTISQ